MTKKGACKKYVSEHGFYLEVRRAGSLGGWLVVWAHPDAGPSFMGVSDLRLSTGGFAVWRWERRTTARAMAKTEPEVLNGYYVFSSEQNAQHAIDKANEALLAGVRKPWPDWALKARNNGWQPPKGWKP